MSTTARGLIYIWKIQALNEKEPFTKEDWTKVQKYEVDVVIEWQRLTLDSAHKPELSIGKTYMLPVWTRSVLWKNKDKAYTFFFLRNEKPTEVI